MGPPEGPMVLVKGGNANPLSQLERAHQKAGAHSTNIHAEASKFYQDFAYGGMLKESKLKLRVALDPSSRPALNELWNILFQQQKGEGARLDRLQGWMSTNKGLVGWMSAPTQQMLTRIAGGGAGAKAIDAEIERAQKAGPTPSARQQPRRGRERSRTWCARRTPRARCKRASPNGSPS